MNTIRGGIKMVKNCVSLKIYPTSKEGAKEAIVAIFEPYKDTGRYCLDYGDHIKTRVVGLNNKESIVKHLEDFKKQEVVEKYKLLDKETECPFCTKLDHIIMQCRLERLCTKRAFLHKNERWSCTKTKKGE